MSGMEIRKDCFINYSEFEDGDWICLQLETPEGITDEINLTRSAALYLAHMIIENLENYEKDQ